MIDNLQRLIVVVLERLLPKPIQYLLVHRWFRTQAAKFILAKLNGIHLVFNPLFACEVEVHG